MKIRRGIYVRVLRTNEIGKIKDIELIKKEGKVHRYCCLQMTKGGPDLWMDSSELGDTKEVAVVTFESKDNGYVIKATCEVDHKSQNRRMHVKEVECHPIGLMLQGGLHRSLLANMIAGSKE